MADVRPDPLADFPPFGYLDNPFHSWKLHPSGVLRSRPPAGMGWHTPNFGSYGRNGFAHRAHLHAGIEVAGVSLVTPSDFMRQRVVVRAFVHSANRLGYIFHHPAGLDLRATYFLIGDDALGCHITLSHESAQPGKASARIWLAQELAHNPATSRLWEHGLYAVSPATPGAGGDAYALLGVCPEGDAWVHGSATSAGVVLLPGAVRHTIEPWEADARLPVPPESREPAALQRGTLLLGYDIALPEESDFMLHAVLARGVSADHARSAWDVGQRDFAVALEARAAADQHFWRVAPRLHGAWPAHLARGLATDLETLRTTARPPSGIFTREWDGMQIQAPRLVLAETALDALALAWADPARARALLLEAFAAAPRPNVPCMREDGSFNMVADDGTICGTGPEWGWPLAVVDTLWRRSGDRDWLAAIFPLCARYLDWWLTERVDAEGWPVHACSWESGQDVSARFGEQRTGGSDVRHIRPVDLAAALAQGCALLAEWAETLEYGDEVVRLWRERTARGAEQVRALWRERGRDSWYHDWDARAGRPSAVRDPMHLAPLACGLAGPDEVARLIPAFATLPMHGGVWPPLVWPPVAHTVLEAALAAGQDARAAAFAMRIVERVWMRMDARTLEPDGSLPGVTREFWPEGGMSESAGIEGYGWGALTAHLLIRYVLGLRDLAADRFALVPALPATWRRPSAVLAVGPLAYGSGSVTLSYHIPDDGRSEQVEVSVMLADLGDAFVARAESGSEMARGVADAGGAVVLLWKSRWLQHVVIQPA